MSKSKAEQQPLLKPSERPSYPLATKDQNGNWLYDPDEALQG